VRINGEPATVIGVMPEGFAFPQKQDLWLPLVTTPDVQRRNNRSLWFAFGRLAPGATFESAQSELDALGRRLAAEYPDSNRDYFPQARTFNEFFIGANENLLYQSMWGAVGFVLLIACANLANLMLARALGRTREIAVRAALGAGYWRIVRQLLAESVMLSALGGVLGWWIAKGIVRLYSLAERGPGLLPWRVLDYTMDYRVLGYLTAIALGTGLVFGLAPALKLAKLGTNAGLKDGQRAATGGRRGKNLSGVLIGAEVALAVVLLVGAGLMVRSYLNVAWTDPGVATRNVLTALVQLPAARYPDAETRTALFENLETRLDALPGVDSVAFASALPTWGARQVTYELRESGEIDAAQRPTTFAITVGPKYFATLDAPLLAGREFAATDGPNAPPVAIVNRAFAGREWPGEDPIGKRLRFYDGAAPKGWLTVVGVAGNVAQTDAARQAFDPLVYLPYRQEPAASLWAIVKSRESAAVLGASLRLELQRLDAALAFWLGPFTLEERMAEGYWDKQLYGILFVSFAAIALLLASLGLYAIVAYSVNAHTREIGIRLAVGATARDVIALVIKQSMAPVLIGLLAGIAGAIALTRVLESELVHVSATDPTAYAAACLVLLIAAALGSWLPARRATRVDPVTALRED
jgi:predicted permease